jgi:hypothetical protein
VKLKKVRVFPRAKDGLSLPPVDIDRVRSTHTRDGLYTVTQASGLVYRFPCDMIFYVTETPPRNDGGRGPGEAF